jgi:glycosyltransferase involved in cell wall biosynthesis
VLNACSNADLLLRFDLPAPVDPELYICAGKATERKGVDYFLQVAEEVVRSRPKATFLWIGDFGDGPYSRKALRQHLADRGIERNVAFTGYIDEPRPIYYRAGAFLLLSRDEPFPKFLQEGLALGKVCIGFETGGIPDVLGGYGHVVALGDTGEVARRLTGLGDEATDLQAQRQRRASYEARLTPQRFAPEFAARVQDWDAFWQGKASTVSDATSRTT